MPNTPTEELDENVTRAREFSRSLAAIYAADSAGAATTVEALPGSHKAPRAATCVPYTPEYSAPHPSPQQPLPTRRQGNNELGSRVLSQAEPQDSAPSSRSHGWQGTQTHTLPQRGEVSVVGPRSAADARTGIDAGTAERPHAGSCAPAITEDAARATMAHREPGQVTATHGARGPALGESSVTLDGLHHAPDTEALTHNASRTIASRVHGPASPDNENKTAWPSTQPEPRSHYAAPRTVLPRQRTLQRAPHKPITPPEYVLTTSPPATLEGPAYAGQPHGADAPADDATSTRAASPEANPARARTPGKQEPAAQRQDIQFLRALAVGLVLLAHAKVAGFEGGFVGVDVFFVISGYLITAGLLRQAGRGTVDLPTFFARRLRRLMPPALLVIVTTLAAVWTLAPSLEQSQMIRDGAWSALWIVNYIFAESGLDYHDAGSPSPFLHFWSLAIEEQFYIVWPVLIAATTVVVTNARRAVGVLAGVIVVASLAASQYLTDQAAPTAYFSLQSRAWELAAGAALAAAFPALRSHMRLSTRWQVGLSATGLAVIVGSALLVTPATAFPGLAAVPAVAGTALMLWAGRAGATLPGVTLRPVQGLGNISYGVYLWHWPLLVVLPWALGRDATLLERLAAVALAIGLASVTYEQLERRVQTYAPAPRRWIPAGLTMIAATATVAASLAAWQPASPPSTLEAQPAPTTSEAFADQLRSGTVPDSVISAVTTPAPISSSLTPPVTDVGSSAWQEVLGDCHQEFEGAKVLKGCLFGDVNAERTAVLVGDSHAAHWAAAVDRIGVRNGWRVAIWTKSACPLMAVDLYSSVLKRNYDECEQWQSEVISRVRSLRPDVLLFSHSATTEQMLPDGVTWTDAVTSEAENYANLADHIWHIEDTPHSTFDVPQCVADNLDNVGACAVDLADHPTYLDQWRDEERVYADYGFSQLKTRDLLVYDGKMPVVVNDRLVLLDKHHLSNEFAEHLAPIFEQVLPEQEMVPQPRPTSA